MHLLLLLLTRQVTWHTRLSRIGIYRVITYCRYTDGPVAAQWKERVKMSQKTHCCVQVRVYLPMLLQVALVEDGRPVERFETCAQVYVPLGTAALRHHSSLGLWTQEELSQNVYNSDDNYTSHCLHASTRSHCSLLWPILLKKPKQNNMKVFSY